MVLKSLLGATRDYLRRAPIRYKYFIKPTNHFKQKPLFSATPKEEMIAKAMHFAKACTVEGDYLEFGVFEGKSFVPAYHYGNRLNKKMKYYAFDSFEGLPEIKGIDKKGHEFHKGKFACSLSNFKEILRKNAVDQKKVHLVKGWYDKILNEKTKKKLPLKKAAIVWIDCDIYESTVPVMKFITDYVVDGTVLIFDDWFCYKSDPSKGEQRAFNEWLKKNKNITCTPFHHYGLWGTSFIVHKK